MPEQLERVLAATDDTGGDRVIADALAVIDEALSRTFDRDLISSGEVADLLLDVRSALTAPAGA